MKPFAIENALQGDPVYHRLRKLHVENIVVVGNRVAFTIPDDGDTIYSCLLNGNNPSSPDEPILFMAHKNQTIYVNLWNSPSSHYTTYSTLEAAMRDTRGVVSASKSTHRHNKINPDPIAITVNV